MAGLEKFEGQFKALRDFFRERKKLLAALTGSLTLSYVAAVVVNSLAMSLLLDGAYAGQSTNRRGGGGDPGAIALALGPKINYHDVRKAIEERNVFNSDGEFPQEEEAKVEAGDDNKPVVSDFNLDAPCNKTSLKLTLLGTIYMGDDSVATIQEQGYSESDVYKLGDLIIGQETARIAKIERQRVIINNSGTKECLDLIEAKPQEPGFGDIDAGGAPPADFEPTPPPADAASTSDCELQEKFVQDQLGPGFGTIIQKARLVPNTVDNQVNGFKIFAIEGNSLFARAGLKNGDVITQVNDVSLKQPEQGFALYQAFQDETDIRINVLRNGNTPVMITCRIK